MTTHSTGRRQADSYHIIGHETPGSTLPPDANDSRTEAPGIRQLAAPDARSRSHRGGVLRSAVRDLPPRAHAVRADEHDGAAGEGHRDAERHRAEPRPFGYAPADRHWPGPPAPDLWRRGARLRLGARGTPRRDW